MKRKEGDGLAAVREPMLDMFLFETTEMIEQLQQLMLESEKSNEINPTSINEIFRIMHTIKGSSGMMMFDNISHLAHAIEDVFFFIRESKPTEVDYSMLADLVLEGGDMIKEETDRIDAGEEADSDFSGFIGKVKDYLQDLKVSNGFEAAPTEKKQGSKKAEKFYIANDSSKTKDYNNCFSTVLFFEEKCEMENIRGYTVLHRLEELAEVLHYEPENILESDTASEKIQKDGFKIYFKSSKTLEEIDEFLKETIFLDRLELTPYENQAELLKAFPKEEKAEVQEIHTAAQGNGSSPSADVGIPRPVGQKASLISVDIHKLDKLMDLVGELVISESMVSNNHELNGLQLDDFYKATRQHRKRISDLQDVVMSIRMVSLSPVLNKMNRIVRDMAKKLEKKATLYIIGEDTEVDKNIIEHIGDPMMHIIRNSMDHGIETEPVRLAKGKPAAGQIVIEAKNTGGDVLITIKDDGKGLDRDKILERAIENGVIDGDGRNLSDRDIYATIFSPGLSTKEVVTEFSGRGVGMDVVVKEIEKVRGSVTVDSAIGEGTTITIKIPLTVAILDGMIVRVGDSIFTIPVTSIKQSIIVKNSEVIRDLDGKEMITIRGECFSILRLHEMYKIETEIKQVEEGIVIMVEEDGRSICVFADELLGEQQVVIKALPEYINKVRGTSGCTLLGDGRISLILDVSQLVNM